MKRRLELEGRPGSFFEVEWRGGAELHVAFGARDRVVTPRVRTFPSEKAAQAEIERLVAAHEGKGYVEKIEAPPPPSPMERLAWTSQQVARVRDGSIAPPNPELEAACDAAPDDPAPWQVLADWLTERNDPRGEVALCALRGMTVDARAVMNMAIPNISFHADTDRVELLEIRFGFLVSARVDLRARDKTPAMLEELLACPLAASLRELRIGLGYPKGDWTPALKALCASPIAARLHRLVFDASNHLPRNEEQYETFVNRVVGSGDDVTDADVQEAQEIVEARTEAVVPVRFAPTAKWSALSALRSLVIEGPFRGDLGTLDLPELRELVIRSDRLRDVSAIVNARCPKLERLELWCGPEDPTGLEPLCAEGVLPSLRELALFDLDPGILDAFREAELVSRVRFVTEIPDGGEVARYADPLDRGIVRPLPRGGEPPGR